MEGFDLFDKMMQKIDHDITLMLVRSEIRQNIERKEVSKKKITNDSDDTIKKQPKKSDKIGRNDPCPCGSGKKYKQCCGKQLKALNKGFFLYKNQAILFRYVIRYVFGKYLKRIQRENQIRKAQYFQCFYRL